MEIIFSDQRDQAVGVCPLLFYSFIIICYGKKIVSILYYYI